MQSVSDKKFGEGYNLRQVIKVFAEFNLKKLGQVSNIFYALVF